MQGGIINTIAGVRRLKLSFAGCLYGSSMDIDDVVVSTHRQGAQPAQLSAVNGCTSSRLLCIHASTCAACFRVVTQGA